MTTTIRLADVQLCSEIVIHSAAAERYADLYLTVLDARIARDGWVTLEVALRNSGGIRELSPMPPDTLAYIYEGK